jgi:hypothetical protein
LITQNLGSGVVQAEIFGTLRITWTLARGRWPRRLLRLKLRLAVRSMIQRDISYISRELLDYLRTWPIQIALLGRVCALRWRASRKVRAGVRELSGEMFLINLRLDLAV